MYLLEKYKDLCRLRKYFTQNSFVFQQPTQLVEFSRHYISKQRYFECFTDKFNSVSYETYLCKKMCVEKFNDLFQALI